MMLDHPPQLFHSFNARSLSPEKVANSFVVSDHYERLVHPVHTLIVGPRGSGKTTLLKMLTGEALESWHAPEADHYREQIEYSGVFVATDRLWASQVRLITVPCGGSEQVVRALFGNYLMRAIVGAMIRRCRSSVPEGNVPHNRATLSERDEKQIARDVACAMDLPLAFPSLLAVKHACLANLRQLSNVTPMSSPSSGGISGGSEVGSFLHSALLAIEMFNDYVGEPGRKWALLFDELELAPSFIVRELIEAMRSVDEQFLFKLSLSPHTHVLNSEMGPNGPMRNQDFEQLDLWYSHKEAGYPFAESLVKSLLLRRGIDTEVSASEVFGGSEFAATAEEMKSNDSAYKAESRRLKTIARLADKDPTFVAYLEREGVTVSQIPELPGPRRAQIVRKVMPLVLLRDELLANGGTVARKRSRKRVPDYFLGIQSLLAMTEGNPRWIIGLVGRMLDNMKIGDTRVTLSAQAREVERAMNRFRALLRTIPCEGPQSSPRRRGLLEILDAVGEHFFRMSALGDFDPDPAGSFMVDSNEDDRTVEALGQALNAGAIVFIPEHQGDTLLRSIRGKRFRLCYLLSPHYRIPIRLGRWQSLGSILRLRESSADGYFEWPREERA